MRVDLRWCDRSTCPSLTVGARRFVTIAAQGFSLVAVGAGWLVQWPVMVAAGLVVGFEETIETSIAAWALKQEAEGREGFG